MQKLNEIITGIEEEYPDLSFFRINRENIKYYSESFKMCEANACGCFKTNWACSAEAAGQRKLYERVKAYKKAAVFIYKYKLADNYDWTSMKLALENFGKLCRTIQDELKKSGINSLVLGAGACSLCGTCTYPEKPCRHPELLIYPLEAAGIYAYSLLDGTNNKTPGGEREYIGLIAYN